MKFSFIVAIILLVLISLFVYYMVQSPIDKNAVNEGQVRYVALGDSYTIGSGISESENFPTQLIDRLREKNIDIELVANPAVSGYTTEDLIDYELSVFDSSQATFVTILIGANDVAIGMSEEVYRRNLQYILDYVQEKLPNKKNIILLTIPDFSLTPVGKQFGSQIEIRQMLGEFNNVIFAEGKKRDLPVVDLYEVSQVVENDSSLIVGDGLHPDSRQYEMWVEEIGPVAEKLLSSERK